jgi:REP element-mobilizing transposase RayT
MEDVDTLSHTTWDCKYHMVLIPKYRLTDGKRA